MEYDPTPVLVASCATCHRNGRARSHTVDQIIEIVNEQVLTSRRIVRRHPEWLTLASIAMTVFKRIIDREIPAEIVYEDDLSLAFRDINAQAPVHIIIIPKKEIPSLAHTSDADEQLLGHLLVVARKVAEQLQLANGYRTVINCGADAGQTVSHLHIHLLGGRALGWPPG